jgi:hypothetical protein
MLSGGQGIGDELARDEDAVAGRVNSGPSSLPDSTTFRRLDLNADSFQHFEGSVVNANNVLFLQRAVPTAKCSWENNRLRRPFPSTTVSLMALPLT